LTNEKSLRSAKSPPRYRIIADQLLDDIQSGQIGVGDVLEPEEELGAKFNASRGTIRQSLALLEEAGVIERKQRSGTRILSRFPGRGLVKAEQLLEDWARYGIEYPLVLSSISRRELPQELAKGADRLVDRWLCFVGLRYPIGSRIPIAHFQSFLHPRYADIEQDLTPRPVPLFARIEQRYGRVIESVQVQLRAIPLPEEMAKGLGCVANEPALQLRRIYLDAKRQVVSIALNTHPADRYTYNVEIPRQPDPTAPFPVN
jgi:DNA-binding GntR family transcriptional regulator